jgi:broad specificity phosphatase PhoE
MTKIILIRSCLTDFDEEGRIKGTLDIPLNAEGNRQAANAALALADQDISIVCYSPNQSAQQTAEVLAKAWGVKAKSLKNMQNLNHGLWQGKRVDELREKQKKVYRQWQDQPDTICPPEGEMVSEALDRIKTVLDKLIKKHKNQVIALVAPEPLTSLVRCYLEQSDIGDLWENICECGSWLVVDVEPKQLATMAANQT